MSAVPGASWSNDWRSRTRRRHWLLVGLLLAAASCTEPNERSTVIVTIDADSAVRGRVLDVEALLEAQDAKGSGFQMRANRHFMPNSNHRWPLQFSVQAEAADLGGSYQLTATGLNRQRAVVEQARVFGRVQRGENLHLRAHFEASCFNRSPLCPYGLTCSDAMCVSADGDPYGRTRPEPDGGTTAADGGGQVREPSAGGVVEDGATCEVQGLRACAGHASLTPLLCDGSAWRAQAECNANERCETEAGELRGQCRPIAQECINKQPDVPFCDAQERMLVCTDLVSSLVRACGENKRCVPDGGNARCDCIPGYIDDLDGAGCRKATSCSKDNGGCDPQSTCTPAAGGRICGSCPDGYQGDGTLGCSPLLTALVPSAGTLQPAFSPDVFEYTIKVPMLVQRVAFTASAPSSARIALNGSPIASGTSGESQVLMLGDNMAELVVSSERGVPTAYRVKVERSAMQEAYLKAHEPGDTDHLGYSLAADGDTIAVGAFYEDSKASGVNGDASDNSLHDAGAVYVFVRTPSGWVQQAYLKAGDPSADSFFGTSVAIDGDTIAVGQIEDDIYNTLIAPKRPGAVYVFTRSGGNWSQQAKLTVKDGAAGDMLGFSVALDGDTLVAGAARGDSDVADSGLAYVFTRAGDRWTEGPKLKASMPARGSLFGSEVGIAGDSLVVAAQEEGVSATRGGAVYAYQRAGSGWSAPQRLQPPKPILDATFGFGMTIHGNTLAVGAPRAELVVGTASRRAPGEVYLFERSSDRWTQTAVVKALKPEVGDYFGFSVALSDTALFVGAPGEASGGRGVNPDPAKGDMPFSGAGYLFARNGQAWAPSGWFKASNADESDGFGYNVVFTDQAAVVSAIYESSGGNGVNGDQDDNSSTNAGAVYALH